MDFYSLVLNENKLRQNYRKCVIISKQIIFNNISCWLLAQTNDYLSIIDIDFIFIDEGLIYFLYSGNIYIYIFLQKIHQR